MKVFAIAFSTGFSLLFLALMFAPIERAFPARKQKFFRPEWWTDLAFFLGQYLLWSGLVLGALQFFQGWLDRAMPPHFRNGDLCGHLAIRDAEHLRPGADRPRGYRPGCRSDGRLLHGFWRGIRQTHVALAA